MHKTCMFDMFVPFRDYPDCFLSTVDIIREQHQAICEENGIDYFRKDDFLSECDLMLRSGEHFGGGYHSKIVASDYMRCRYAMELLTAYDTVIYVDADLFFFGDMDISQIISRSEPMLGCKNVWLEDANTGQIHQSPSITNSFMVMHKDAIPILQAALDEMQRISNSSGKIGWAAYGPDLFGNLAKHYPIGTIDGLSLLDIVTDSSIEKTIQHFDSFWQRNYRTQTSMLNVSFTSNYLRLAHIVSSLLDYDRRRHGRDNPWFTPTMHRSLAEARREERNTKLLLDAARMECNNLINERLKREKRRLKKTSPYSVSFSWSPI